MIVLRSFVLILLAGLPGRCSTVFADYHDKVLHDKTVASSDNVAYSFEVESVTYKFKTNGGGKTVDVDITARVVSSPGSHETFTMEILKGNEVKEIEYFKTTGKFLCLRIV